MRLLSTEGQFCQWSPWLPGDQGGWGWRREEVKPLGNPLSQAVGRRRHHRGSWAGQGQGFPTGCKQPLGPVEPSTPAGIEAEAFPALSSLGPGAGRGLRA
jgi:hypothetical protein